MSRPFPAAVESFLTVASWRRASRAALLPALFAALVATVGAPSTASAQIVQLPDFTELVDRVGPAVVNIRTTERRTAPGAGPGGEIDPSIEEFFRRFGIPIPNHPLPRGTPRPGPRGDDDEPRQRGVGSGFVLSADGYVMTNAHVVDGAEEVIVTLTDKRELRAKIIGTDRRTDVALVKVEATGLPFVKVGDVGRLKVGEWVVAIGSPFGLENSVTAGIVSAKQRDTGEYLPFIQTDVAINPGNSGGPLLNMRGEVVGINSQIYSRSGGYMGISFAIPIDEAMRVSEQLRASGRVIRGRIGVQIGQVTKEIAESIGLGAPRGALVTAVEKDQPAEKAGVEAGDIIVKVDGRAVDRAGDLPRLIGSSQARRRRCRCSAAVRRATCRSTSSNSSLTRPHAPPAARPTAAAARRRWRRALSGSPCPTCPTRRSASCGSTVASASMRSKARPRAPGSAKAT